MDTDTKLRTLSLFSGIGGIDIGLRRWCKTVCYVECDSYVQATLTKNMAAGFIDVAPLWDDVTTFGESELEKVGPIECVTGGFPCQDISCAGKGAGIHGERSGLFFEIIRIIRLARPKYIFLENVAALLARGMDTVLSELSESGYGTKWDCIPASTVGAHFFGDRVWILAQSPEALSGGPQSKSQQSFKKTTWDSLQFERLVRNALQLSLPAGRYDRLSDGIPFRTHRLKCLGNSVVPQCCEKAFEILEK